MKRKSIVFLITTVMVFTMMGSLSAFADDRPVITTLEAPQIIAVNVKTHVNGSPYFEIKWKNPQSIKELFAVVDEIGEAPLEYLLDTKIGDGKWRSEMGETISGNSLHGGDMIMDFADYDPINSGELDTIDIKANVYRFRVQYAYLNSIDEEEYYTYSPFSNIVSIGAEAFYKEASDWAKSELQKANDLGLIPDILKGADMTKPITREEFAELAVVLYERVTDKKSEPVSPNPFTDTANPQILKAYNLGITSGTSQTTFSPKVLINREQCAAMLFRAIKAIHPQGDYSVAGVKDFPDQKHISSWAVEATKYMNKIGVIAGDAQGNFMPKATTPAQEAAGYGMATREQAIALSVRTHNKAPEIKASSADNTNPDTDASRKAANSGPLPADIRAKLPDGFPNIPIAADAEFDSYLSEVLSRDDNIAVVYTSRQTLEALYYLYVDFLKGTGNFFTHKRDDGSPSNVSGFKDGWGISVNVGVSAAPSQVNMVQIITVKPHEEY